MTQFDNLYDSQNVAKSSETPPLDEIIRRAIAADRVDLHTALPAHVTAVLSTGQVHVQPLLKTLFKTGELVDLPVVQNVPIVAPRGTNYFMQLPVAVGDTGLLVFAERSLDAWLVSGGSVDPDNFRMHDLSDAVFIPGLYPFSTPTAPKHGAPDPTALVFGNGAMELWLTAAGMVKASNGPAELVSLINQILSQVIAVNTVLATAPVSPPLWIGTVNAAAAAAATAYATIQASLLTLIAP